MPLEGALWKGSSNPSAHAFLRGDDRVGGRRGPAEVIPVTAMMPSTTGPPLPLLLQLQLPRRAQSAAQPVADQQLHRDEAAEHRLKETWTGAVEPPSTGSARPPCPGSAALPEVPAGKATFMCRGREIGPVFPCV